MAIRAKGLMPPKIKVGTASIDKSADMRKKVTPVIPKLKATGIPIETVNAKHAGRTKKTAFSLPE